MELTGSKLRKEYVKAVYCHPAYLNFYAEYIMWNARLGESQGGIKNSRRNINNLRYWHIYIYLRYSTTLMAESEEELKSFLRRMKEKSQKAGLKLNI